MKKILVAAFAALFFTAPQAQATVYGASEALSDGIYHTAGHNHAIWLADAPILFGTGRDFVFGDEGGILNIQSGVGGSFIATVFSETHTNSGFSVTLNLSTPFGNATPAPKQELNASAYVEGGPVDTGTFDYFSFASGTLTGFGVFEGLSFNVTQRPSNGLYPFQIGVGASNKNVELGASGWFFYEVAENTSQFVNLTTGSRFQGDININLSVINVPAPAGILTLLPGLLALGAFRRRA